MPNFDTTSRVEAHSWQSQSSILSEFERLRSEDCVRNKSKFLDLDEEKLQILLVVSEFDGIGAKTLGQKTHLSRSAALSHAKQLVELDLLISRQVPTPKTGIRSPYSFHLAPGITKEAIESVIRQKEPQSLALLNVENSSSTDALKHPIIGNKQHPGLTGLAFVESQVPDLSFLKLRLSKLHPTALDVLKLVKANGITVIEAAKEIKRSPKTAQKYLKDLLDLGWLIRDEALNEGMGRGEYIYFLAAELTAEVIEAGFSSAEASAQFYINKEEAFETPLSSIQCEVSTQNGAMKVKAELHQPQDSSGSSTTTIEGILAVLKELTQKVVDLEDRFVRLEQSLQTDSDVNPDELLAILRSKKSNIKR